MEASKNDNLSAIVGRNIKELRIQANLTIEGLTFALSISISYTLMIERGAANISTRLAKKIANFFDIEMAQLYSSKPIKIRPLKILPVEQFHKDNKNNPKFFLSKRTEYSVASFLRNVLLSDEFVLEYHSVGDLRNFSKEKYQRDLNSQELSRELRRLYMKGILERDDRFNNGSVYLYKLKISNEQL
ncbi:helix-turn-helix domain-containing protein [Pararcticibacter amylolyticus]|uniref:HTH cro/C1-type domain-containing protein n=1 Tax=Pararcticibacter amylolyticus TaxID=2173175 RepID=A0A2U2PJ55_9SPHI|nr:helix-turn-helix transcriptional regulator [Pararcticibacter amylolyticus]PWG81189.1 hypothetical protein DDR33_07320 [Pararcticibacter amylolyticus]